MTGPAATDIRIIDADTHLTEPVDLWTARIPARFRDQAPRVSFDEATQSWRWQIGDRLGPHGWQLERRRVPNPDRSLALPLCSPTESRTESS